MSRAAPRFLVVRLSALGDIIHTLPSFRALRRRFPHAAVDWLVEDRFAHLLAAVEGIDSLLTVPRRPAPWARRVRAYTRLRTQLSAARYEIAFDFQGLTKSAVWPWLARVPRRVGFGADDGRELSRLFYTDRVVPDPSRLHVVERNLSLVEHVAGDSIPLEAADTYFPPDPDAAAWARDYWERNALDRLRVAVVNPCAGWETKRWTPSGYAAVAGWLARLPGWKCLISWGPGEEEQAGEVARMSGAAALLPPTRIHHLAEVLRRAALCVSGDTGPLHLAAAVGIPCVALFGATDPRRNGPYGVPSRTLTFPLDCAPCWKTDCPLEHRRCLADLAPETVIREIGQLLPGV